MFCVALLLYILLDIGKRVDKIQHKYLYYCGLGQKEEEVDEEEDV
jgi:hypothetical protein